MTIERAEPWVIANTRAGAIASILVALSLLFAGVIWVDNVGTRADKALDRANAVAVQQDQLRHELEQQRYDIVDRLVRMENLMLSHPSLRVSSRSRKQGNLTHTSDVQNSSVSNGHKPE